MFIPLIVLLDVVHVDVFFMVLVLVLVLVLVVVLFYMYLFTMATMFYGGATTCTTLHVVDWTMKNLM